MANVLYWDLETHNAGRQIELGPRKFVRLFQYAWNDGPVKTTTDYDEMLEIVRSADYLVAHNQISFDLTALFGYESLEPLYLAMDRKVIDTFYLAHLLRPAPIQYRMRSGRFAQETGDPVGHAMMWLGLDNLCYQFNLEGKTGDLKEIAKRFNPPKTPVRDLDFGLIDLDDPEFKKYADQDIIAVRSLYKYLLREIKIQDYPGEYIWREMEALSAICGQMHRNGINVDQEFALNKIKTQAERRDELLARLVAEYDFPTEGKSPWASAQGKEATLRALADFGFTPENTPDWPRTPKGAPKLGGKDLLLFTEGTDAEEFVKALGELKGQRSTAQLVLDNVKPDGRVHPDITSVQRSGRYSFTRPGVTIFGDRTPELRQDKAIFRAEPGNVMAGFDYSSADARAMAALSGDIEYAKRFEKDEDGNDLHDSHNLTGEAVFGADAYYGDGPRDKNARPKLRAAAKVCIAAGQLVLTDTGLVPIEDVTLKMRVWDGQSFVTHQGIVYNGVKEVITYDGLTATADHIVFAWQKGQAVEVPFGLAASGDLRLITTEVEGRAVRVCHSHFGTGEVRTPWQRSLRPGTVSPVLRRGVGDVPQPAKRVISGVPELLPPGEVQLPPVVGAQNGGHTAKMPKSKESGVLAVRGPRNPVRVGERGGSVGVGLAEPRSLRAGSNLGPGRHERELRAGESATSRSETATIEQAGNRAVGVSSRALALQLRDNAPVLAKRVHEGRNNRSGKVSGQDQGVALPARRRKTRVYDIRLAGPHNRFTVSGKLVHNCGHSQNYQIGAWKLAVQLNLVARVEKLDLFFWAPAGRKARPIPVPDKFAHVVQNDQLTGESVPEGMFLTRDMIDQTNEAFPWLTLFKEKAYREAEQFGYVTNPWGRRIHVAEGREYTGGPAAYGQSVTTEKIKDAVLLLIRKGDYYIRSLRALIHDELLLEFNEDTIERDVKVVKECMETPFDPGTPTGQVLEFPVGVGYGPTWEAAGH